MLAFFILIRNFFHVIRILFKQEEQKALMIMVGALFLIGTVFYHNVEQFSILDAFYFSVMTLATVGYGDLVPQTAFGKLFSIVYVMLGVGVLSAVIVNFNMALKQYHRDKKNKEERK
ncbi:potassium channel family protein [Exiguobacterium acetylicum]|uniref:potassium channel family protein n=1 Tax=Exiguobacterium acetylicum TaxID=41170 RepID=UPI003977CEDA